jgi:hypothetical protein
MTEQHILVDNGNFHLFSVHIGQFQKESLFLSVPCLGEGTYSQAEAITNKMNNTYKGIGAEAKGEKNHTGDHKEIYNIIWPSALVQSPSNFRTTETAVDFLGGPITCMSYIVQYT